MLSGSEHAHIMLSIMATSPHTRTTENNAVAAVYDWAVVARQIVLELVAASAGAQDRRTDRATPCCLTSKGDTRST
jgi:hypothetical protein